MASKERRWDAWTGKEPSILEQSLFKEKRLPMKKSSVLAMTVGLFRTEMAKFQF